MAVKIRLRRMGAHKKPFYRIIVADSRSPRDGRFIEELGYYNPLTDPATVKIDALKARKWLSIGALPTDTVRALFNKAGISKPGKDEKLTAYTSEEALADARTLLSEGTDISGDEFPLMSDSIQEESEERDVTSDQEKASNDTAISVANKSETMGEEPASETAE